MTSTTAEEQAPSLAKQFEKDLKRTFFNAIVSAIVSGILAALLAFVGFYYNSNSKFTELFKTQAVHSKNLDDMTKTLQNLVSKTDVQGTKPEFQAVEIQDIKKRMDRYEEKQDKIYELLVQINQKSK